MNMLSKNFTSDKRTLKRVAVMGQLRPANNGQLRHAGFEVGLWLI